MFRASCNSDLFFQNHNGSINDIGVTGGLYYNTPPLAEAIIAPASGVLGTTFTFDASGSTDEQTPNTKLQYRWDFNNDGIFDTPFLITPTVQHRFQP